MNTATNIVACLLAVALIGPSINMQAPPALSVVTVNDIKWGPCAAGSPLGCAQAVLFGDPRQSGLFTTRTRVPAGWRALPHYHSGEECGTVISGGPLHVATGDRFSDKAPSAHAVGPGDFYCVPVGVHHFAWADRETVIQIHGVGPLIRTSVNP
jgi:hypothetical protein